MAFPAPGFDFSHWLGTVGPLFIKGNESNQTLWIILLLIVIALVGAYLYKRRM
jgi:hypothetical protein